MRKLFVPVFILLFSLSIFAQTVVPENITVVLSEYGNNTRLVQVSRLEAEKTYNGLVQLSATRRLTEEEQRVLSALASALGTRDALIRTDCRKLSASEKARVQMGSRLSTSKCF